eukprot:EG_transcript_1484
MEWQGGYVNYTSLKALLDAPEVQEVVDQRRALLRTKNDERLMMAIREDWQPCAVLLPNEKEMPFTISDGLVRFRKSSRNHSVAVGRTSPDYAPLIRACADANERFGCVYDIELMSAEAFHLQQCLTTLVKCKQFLQWMAADEELSDRPAVERCTGLVLGLLDRVLDRAIELLLIPHSDEQEPEGRYCPICRVHIELAQLPRMRQHLLEHVTKPVNLMTIAEANFCQVLAVAPTKPFPNQLAILFQQLLPVCERLINFGLLHKRAFEKLLLRYEVTTYQRSVRTMMPILERTSLVMFEDALRNLLQALEEVARSRPAPSSMPDFGQPWASLSWSALGALAVALVSVGDSWDAMRVPVEPDDQSGWAFLILILLSLGLMGMLAAAIVWTWRRVYYAFILRLPLDKARVSHFASFAVWFWSITLIGLNQYILRRRTQSWVQHVPWITVGLCGALTLLQPQPRWWIMSMVQAALPFNITLRDIFVIEWAVSLIPILYHYQFWFCAWPDLRHHYCPCGIAQPPVLATLTAIPILIRLAQDVVLVREYHRQFRSRPRNAFLSSALRYCLMLVTLVLQIVVQQVGVRSILRPIVATSYIVAEVAGQCHEWRWDFNLPYSVRREPGSSPAPWVRHYPTPWLIAGAVSTFLLRLLYGVMSFALDWIPVRPTDWWWVALLFFGLEILRRTIWSLLKVEAEELFNVSGFRSTTTLPIAPLYDRREVYSQPSAFISLMPTVRGTINDQSQRSTSMKAWMEGGQTVEGIREMGGSLYRHVMGLNPIRASPPPTLPPPAAVEEVKPPLQQDPPKSSRRSKAETPREPANLRRRDTVEPVPWTADDTMYGSEASSIVEGDVVEGAGFPIASCYFLPAPINCCVDPPAGHTLGISTLRDLSFLGTLAKTAASPEKDLEADLEAPHSAHSDGSSQRPLLPGGGPAGGEGPRRDSDFPDVH